MEVSGWLPEEAFLQQLERADVCFLNWSFSPELAETGRLSFPLKIHSYIQAQRPMLALGPADSAVSRFVRAYACGAVCDTPDEEKLAEAIQSLATDQRLCSEALRGVMALPQKFSRERFFSTFEAFTQVADDPA